MRRIRDNALLILAALGSAALIFGLLYDVFDDAVRNWTDHDLRRRAHLIGAAVESQTQSGSASAIQRSINSLFSKAELAGLLACTAQGGLIARADGGLELGCASTLAQAAVAANGKTVRTALNHRSLAITAHRLSGSTQLFVVEDRTFLDARRKHVLVVILSGAELGIIALLLLARAGARIGSRRTEEAARSMVRGMRRARNDKVGVSTGLRLLVRDVEDTVEHLRNERRPADGATRLRAFVADQIPNGGVVVIANREPYSHELTPEGKVVVKRPASGLVSGIEPVLRACGGTWIAYGGGSADRANSDRGGRLTVPPEDPQYTLRRVWLGEQQYDRYYCGLSNEGLWPLCHMAHTQPSFRKADWVAYQAVNATFARSAVEETATNGLLLIQDYHFALVPKLVREQAPNIVTSLFWHIPWPHSEVVGICPWKEALLEGMIGADVVGFHTRQYCLNFLDTAQRYLECRVDFDDMSISYGGHRTMVRPYPISVEWPYPVYSRFEGSKLRRSLGIPLDAHVSVGVDRADYTKGLLERIDAVEVLLEQNPSLIGRYVLVQLASPTRGAIAKYQQLARDLNDAVERVNRRFCNASWKPIVLQMRTSSPDEVRKHYAMADSALVTPLHDGMNLVAKEYAASCEDGDGALVLSVFAGASKELEGALLVNPYDAEQVAHAILRAIRMPAAERRARMESMRSQIAKHSIYDWSEKLLKDMCEAKEANAGFWPKRAAAAAGMRREVAG